MIINCPYAGNFYFEVGIKSNGIDKPIQWETQEIRATNSRYAYRITSMLNF